MVTYIESWQAEMIIHSSIQKYIKYGAYLTFAISEQLIDKLLPAHQRFSTKICPFRTAKKHNLENGKDMQENHSFTSRFSVKAAQANCKSLEGRYRVAIVHGEDVFSDLSKLQNYFFLFSSWYVKRRIKSGHKLEILYRSYCNTAFKIKAPALQLFMPSWGFVSKNKWLPKTRQVGGAEICFWLLPFWDQSGRRLLNNLWKRCWCWGSTPLLYRRDRNWMHDALHSPWTSCSKNIQFIWNSCSTIVISRQSWRYSFRVKSSTQKAIMLNCSIIWRLAVIYGELGPQEVRPDEQVL